MHRNLTPDMQNKLLGRVLSGALLLVAASGLMAQSSDQGSYQGPGISSPGVGNIGTRSGEQVDLRYYFGVSGVVDSTIAPFVTDSKGNLIHTPYLYGFEVDGGVYGVHNWKRAQLGLNYAGSYTRYLNEDVYNSNNHSLSLGYTDQISKRLKLDLHESAGSLSYGTGQVANAASADLNSSFTPEPRLFDARTYYLQSSASATWLQSARMSYTVGAGAFLQNLKSEGLSNGWGYSFDGSMMRRMSKSATLGVTYTYSHFEFPGFSSKSDSHTLHGLYATSLGRFWTVSIEAGATVTHVDSLFNVLFLNNNLVPVLVPVDDHRNFQFSDDLSQRHGRAHPQVPARLSQFQLLPRSEFRKWLLHHGTFEQRVRVLQLYRPPQAERGRQWRLLRSQIHRPEPRELLAIFGRSWHQLRLGP